uniref:Uncharacterized protein n=1 Tax=Noctiluca scintillans TaxID=2966 RepID=A0A7S1ANB3_NOCSC
MSDGTRTTRLPTLRLKAENALSRCETPLPRGTLSNSHTAREVVMDQFAGLPHARPETAREQTCSNLQNSPERELRLCCSSTCRERRCGKCGGKYGVSNSQLRHKSPLLLCSALTTAVGFRNHTRCSIGVLRVPK